MKFRVPRRDDPVEDETEAATLNATPPEGVEAVEQVEEASSFTFSFGELDEKGSSTTRSGGSSPSVATGSGLGVDRHPLAEAFMKLWVERERGSVVELHLADGTLLVPERFSRDLSRRNCGVFAVKDPDGTYTLIALNWDSVARVSIRHLSRLPKRMFD